MNKFTEYFRNTLHASKLTQAQLARKAGIRQQALNKIYNGENNPKLCTLLKIEQALPGFDLYKAVCCFREDAGYYMVHISEPAIYTGNPDAGPWMGTMAGTEVFSTSLEVCPAPASSGALQS